MHKFLSKKTISLILMFTILMSQTPLAFASSAENATVNLVDQLIKNSTDASIVSISQNDPISTIYQIDFYDTKAKVTVNTIDSGVEYVIVSEGIKNTIVLNHNGGIIADGNEIQQRAGYEYTEFLEELPSGVTGPWTYKMRENCNVELGRSITAFSFAAIGILVTAKFPGVPALIFDLGLYEAYQYWLKVDPNKETLYMTRDFYSNRKPVISGHTVKSYSKVYVTHWGSYTAGGNYGNAIGQDLMYSCFTSTI